MPQGKETPPGPPPLSDVDDSGGKNAAPPTQAKNASAPDRLAQFLSRAGAVIALDRGINARSRVKLAAIADELELSDEQFAAAMERLQGGKAKRRLSREELRDVRRRKRAFHNTVGETLMALPGGVLTASMEQMLVGAGVEEHGLPRDDAQAEVVELAKKLRIRRITLHEAQRHVEELVGYAIKPDGALPSDVRQRIYAEGSRWGLTPDQVEPILRQRVSQARTGQRREQFRMIALVSAAAAVLVGVLCTIGWMAAASALPDSKATSLAADVDEDSQPERTGVAAPVPNAAPATPRLGVPDWWDDELASYIANVRLRMPALESDLYQLRSPEADVRSDAYQRLIHAARAGDVNDGERAVLSGLLAAAYALDPADACADRLRRSWIDAAVGAGDTLDQWSSDFDTAFWVVETSTAALLHEQLSAPRRTALLDALDQAYGASFERELSALKLRRQIMAAACADLYKSLTQHALENVDLAVDLHDQLLDRAGKYLAPAERDRLACAYLKKLLPALGDRWVKYEALIRRCALSEDPLNVLRMVEVFETTDVGDLRDYLGTQLVLRAGLTAPPRTVDELAAAVRKELGVADAANTVDRAERYAQWRKAATASLGASPASPDDQDELLQQIVATARLATLGAALAQGELGAPEFDALWGEQPPTLASRGRKAPVPRRAPRVNASVLKNLDKYIDLLRGYARLDKFKRLQYMQVISGYARSVTDVQPEQGQAIADYLAAAKSEDEHERLKSSAESVLRWRMVRLGLADHVVESRLRPKHMGQLLEAALHHAVDVEEDGWKKRLRDELLAAIAKELQTESSLASHGPTTADRAAEALADYLRTQAKLSGASAADYGSAATPSELLLLLVEQTSARLSAAALNPSDRRRIDEMPHEIAASQYVAGNDLAQDVQLQRLLLQLLIVQTRQSNPEKAGSLAELQDDLDKKDAAAGHVLQQIAAGQQALLRYWLIHNRP